jgi:ketosteroid isomerase-like protein
MRESTNLEIQMKSLSKASLPMALTLCGGAFFCTPDATVAQSTEADVVAVVDAYHSSLASGDSTTALSLLADDVTILESGGIENKEHYRSGHLSGDMRFAQAVPRERGEVTVRLLGDVAWAWSTSVTEGRMGDREINSQSAELMVLALVDGEWLIKAIHWSSRQRR